jgi:chromosome condensin MukBEF ATPase and DNA-binding subunit MukB
MNWALVRVRWKVDSDYTHKLSPDALAWLRKFEREYYGAEFSANPLHGKAQQRELIAEQDVARRDLATASTRAVLEAQKPARSRDRFVRYYDLADYREFLTSPEEALIALLELRDDRLKIDRKQSRSPKRRSTRRSAATV